MTHSRGTVPVMAAIAGNLVVALLKLAGFLVSNSSSMFSEAIHSFADTANQALLLFGISRSRKKADARFAYGYGNERFLWALISACGIFFVGAGVTIYHGLEALWHPAVSDIGAFSFIVLAVSFVVEAFTLRTALRDLRSHDLSLSLREALAEGDPATVAVVYEDGVAVFGVVVAALGIGLTYLTGNAVWDAIGSIVVGTCLAAVAVILIEKNRAFLIGKAIPSDVQEGIIEMLEADPHIDKVIGFKSTVLDVGHYHMQCEVEWNGAALLTQLLGDGDLEETYAEVVSDYTEFKRFISYTANRVPRLMGRTIDDIETRITKAFPEVDHIDIEIN